MQCVEASVVNTQTNQNLGVVRDVNVSGLDSNGLLLT